MPFKDSVAAHHSSPPSLPPIFLAGEPTSPLPDGMADGILGKIFSIPADAAVAGMVFHLASGDGTAFVSTVAGGGSCLGTVILLGPLPRPEGRDLDQVHPIPPYPSQLCRERIVERTRVLQELVLGSHKVQSMSSLSVAGAVAQVLADILLTSVEGKVGEGGGRKRVWEKWSNNVMEEQVVKLIEDVGAAMQFLQSKAVRIILISIATTICQSHHQNEIPAAKPEPNTHS